MVETTATTQTVPKLIGLTLEKAQKICRLQGLQVRSVEYEEFPDAEGTVVVQSPQPGEAVPAQGLRLIVSAKSYLSLLPNIYRLYDTREGNFLKRFLWIPKQQQFEIDHIIRNLHRYFEAFNAPAKFLRYLASVIALAMDESWEEGKKRELIANMVKIYKLRGTALGLAIYLDIYTGSRPEVLENFWPFNGFQVGVASTVGVDSIIIGYINKAHCFTVRIPMTLADVPVDTIRRIHAIVQAEKPAHTNYYMIFAEPEVQEADFMQIGVASMVGVDSWMGEAEIARDEIKEGKKDDRGKQRI